MLASLLAGPPLWSMPFVACVLAGLCGSVGLVEVIRRLRAQSFAREAEVERLQDRVWRLAESEERYRSLVEAQVDAIVQRDADGLVTFADEGFARIMGQPRDSLVGRRAGPVAVETGPSTLGPDGARLVEEAIETPAGVRWFAWVETAVAGRGGAPETLRAGRDVTDRVAFERALTEARARAEAASEAKSRFLATVSHEFRTPLNGILGMADLVLDTPLTPEQATYVRAVKTSGEALLSLIDEILDFSKIEAGRIDLAAEPFELEPLVEGVVELLAPRAQGKGLEIAAFVAAGCPRALVGDADRLRQVLVNLAGNAVKFTEAGGVGVTVEPGPDGTVVIQVSDTGPGIALDRVPTLFEEFEQGDTSPSRRHGGTGLGLAITRRIVESMGGAIAVESTLGAGSVFRVTVGLPAAGPALRRPAGQAGRRVLVCAKSPFQAPFLVRRLREAGAEAVLAESLPRARAALDAQAFDVLVADWALGDEAARDLARAGRARGVDRCLVLLSPFDRRDLGSPEAAGFDGYLVKPVRAGSLDSRLAPRARPPVLAPARPLPAPPRPAGPGARVLLAEDNEINALLAVKAVEKLGGAVDWARDGGEALALMEAALAGERRAYDLVLMDVRMPGMDGLEATRRIRAAEAARDPAVRCPIVALTANAAKEDEAAARAAGLDGFLAKPFDLNDLARLLRPAEPPQARAS